MALTPSQVTALLLRLIPAKARVLLVGRPGIGKSDVYAQVAAMLGMRLMLKHPVVEDPTDYKGLPYGVKVGTRMTAEFLPYGDLREMCEAEEPTLVVFEDLGQAVVAVQAALMQVLLVGKINGQAISPHVHMVAASNRREDKAGVGGLIEPLKDRFTTILEMEFHHPDWARWAIAAGVSMEIVSFNDFRPGFMKDFKPSRDMKKSPTPRSMAGLDLLLKTGISEPEAFKGAIGDAAGTEFTAYHRVWTQLPDIGQIFLDPAGAPVPEEASVVYATMGMLAEHTMKKNMDAAVAYLERFKRREFMALCMKAIIRRDKESTKCAAFVKWAAKHADLMGADNEPPAKGKAA